MQTSFSMALQRLHHPEKHPGQIHNEQHPAAWFEWGAQWLVYSIDTPSWQAPAAGAIVGCSQHVLQTIQFVG